MKNFNIKQFSAVGDGVTMNTIAVQTAIDVCGEAGGGVVSISEGVYLCGRIDLRSGVELHIDVDGVLLGSKNGYDFPEIETIFWRTEYAPRFNKRCFIYAEGCENIAITGRGIIDCQGQYYVDPLPENKIYDKNGDRCNIWSYVRNTEISPARVVFFIGCRNVLIEDITMQNQPAGWSYWICDCENVRFDRANIAANVEFPNNDGIHINCSRNVTISNCNITTGDDSIVVRAYSLPLYMHKTCEKVAVTNCNLTSHSAGIRIGWINDGVIRNCTFSNINITDSTSGIDIQIPGNKTGIRYSDEGDEATHIENLNFSDITIDRGQYEPIQIKIDENCSCSAIRNLYFTNIHAYSRYLPCMIGKKDCYIENVYLTNCHFRQIKWANIDSEGVSTNRRPYFEKIKNLVMQNTTFSIE